MSEDDLTDAIAYLQSWHDWNKPPVWAECDRLDDAFNIFVNSKPGYDEFVSVMTSVPMTAGMFWHAIFRDSNAS